jgi:3-oxoadipate CoA-transferase beta subunit
MAWRLAQDLPAGSRAWAGAGLPQLLHEFAADALSAREADRCDLVVLGADEVSAKGEFTGSTGIVPVTARELWIVAPLLRADGKPTLVEHCSQAVPGGLRASRYYSDLAIFDLQDGRVFVRALIEGITLHTLQMELDVELEFSPELTLLQLPAALGGSY